MAGEVDKKSKSKAHAMKNKFQSMMNRARLSFSPPFSLDLVKGT